VSVWFSFSLGMFFGFVCPVDSSGVNEAAEEWEKFVMSPIVGDEGSINADPTDTSCDLEFGYRRCRLRLTPEQLTRHTMVKDLLKHMIHYEPHAPPHGQPTYYNPVLFQVEVTPAESDESPHATPFSAILLLVAVNKNPDVAIFMRCLADDEDLRDGTVIHRVQLVVPTSLIMSIVDHPGNVVLKHVRYKWLPGSDLEVKGLEDISESIWTVPVAVQRKKKPKKTDEAMDIARPTMPVPKKKQHPSRKRTTRNSRTRA